MKISRFVFAIMLVIIIVLGMKAGYDNRQEQNAEVEDSASLASSRGGNASAREANLFDLKRKPLPVLEGIPVTGSPHLIRSPYSTDGPLIDVQGIAAGTKIECPTTKRPFVVPEMADSGPTLFTRRYQVPPYFQSGAVAADPIAERATDQAVPPPSAMDILESRGIVFEEGASAFYNRTTSQLVVSSTAAQLELIEAFVESITVHKDEIQVEVGPGFVEAQ